MMSEEYFTISELNQFIKDVINAGFPQSIWVCGEIQGYNRQKNKNHIFFQLVEKDSESNTQKATIDLVIWSGKKAHIQSILKESEESFALKDDIEVKFLCKVDFYPPHGRVRLTVESIDPYYTLGKLAQEKQKLIALLKEKGVLDQNKQKELSLAPLCVGLITSDDSAAYNDFISELEKSRFGIKVYLRNALMQGKKAEMDVSDAIEELSEIKSLDAIVITRGGGSISDLSCFDSETIAKRIAACRLPVLSAIGHEINITVTDLAAHTYVKTPTAVAQFLADRIQGFCDFLDEQLRKIIEGAEDVIDKKKETLKNMALNLQSGTQQYLKDHNENIIRLSETIKSRPAVLLRDQQNVLVRQQEHLMKSAKVRIHNDRLRLKSFQKIVDALNPVNTMRRGFSITRTTDGQILKNTMRIKKDIALMTELAQGSIESRVVNVNKE